MGERDFEPREPVVAPYDVAGRDGLASSDASFDGRARVLSDPRVGESERGVV